MAKTNFVKEALADTYVGLGDRISMHTGDPGTTGANEAAGGAPAYARKPTDWGTDTTDDGVRTGTEVTFDLPAGSYTHVGLWNSDGTFRDSVAIPGAPITLGAQGQIKVTPTYTQS